MRTPLFASIAGYVFAGLVLAGLVLAGSVFAAPAALAGNPPAEHRYLPYTGSVPACTDDAVLGRIQSRFAQKESEYWNSSLTIAGYDRFHELGYRTEGRSFIPRRYCTARVLMSDQRYRQVSYQIGEGLGIIGWGFGVDFCVSGLDRNLAYAPACRVVQH